MNIYEHICTLYMEEEGSGVGLLRWTKLERSGLTFLGVAIFVFVLVFYWYFDFYLYLYLYLFLHYWTKVERSGLTFLGLAVFAFIVDFVYDLYFIFVCICICVCICLCIAGQRWRGAGWPSWEQPARTTTDRQQSLHNFRHIFGQLYSCCCCCCCCCCCYFCFILAVVVVVATSIVAVVVGGVLGHFRHARKDWHKLICRSIGHRRNNWQL